MESKPPSLVSDSGLRSCCHCKTLIHFLICSASRGSKASLSDSPRVLCGSPALWVPVSAEQSISGFLSRICSDFCNFAAYVQAAFRERTLSYGAFDCRQWWRTPLIPRQVSLCEFEASLV